MTKPFVSVLIDTYNHERFIEQAISSVLEQDFPASGREILVVDDGSTDRTPEIVRKFEPHVRLLRKQNGGQASAFNAGIPECKGEIVAFLDGDDWWALNKLTLATEQLERNPEIGCVGHGYYEVYPDGRPPGVVVADENTIVHLKDHPEARLFTYHRAFLGTTKIVIRKKLLDQILPFPEELIIEADEYMFTLAPALAPALILKEPLFYYRFHSGNLFQYSKQDEAKARRKCGVLEALLRRLPPRLREIGVAEDIIAVVMQPLWIDAGRMRLALDGGLPWETFRIERASYQNSYKSMPLGYRFYMAMVLAATFLVPPRRFYQLREWYAARGLHRVRGLIGEPIPNMRKPRPVTPLGQDLNQ